MPGDSRLHAGADVCYAMGHEDAAHRTPLPIRPKTRAVRPRADPRPHPATLRVKTTMGTLRDIWGRRELLLILVSRNLKIRYKNSTLGFFWSLLGPLFLIVIYWVFLDILKVPIAITSLVTGILVWQFLGTCVGDSLYAILGNANLVTKTAFPRVVLPIATVVANLVSFLLSLIVLVVFLVIVHAPFGSVYLLPFIIATQFALCLGVSLILSSLNVFFRDVEHIINVVLLAW